MKIEMQKLRDAFKVLTDHVEASGIVAVEIPWDYYWDMRPDVLYDPYKDPTGFEMGQLSEDWEKLCEIASGSEPPVGYGLVWLASILRAAGELAEC